RWVLGLDERDSLRKMALARIESSRCPSGGFHQPVTLNRQASVPSRCSLHHSDPAATSAGHPPFRHVGRPGGVQSGDPSTRTSGPAGWFFACSTMGSPFLVASPSPCASAPSGRP